MARLKRKDLQPGKRYRAFHPETGDEIDGTMEQIPGRASIDSFYLDNGALTWDHSGDTEVFWDGMRTEKDEHGNAMFETRHADSVAEDELEFEEIVPEEASDQAMVDRLDPSEDIP